MGTHAACWGEVLGFYLCNIQVRERAEVGNNGLRVVTRGGVMGPLLRSLSLAVALGGEVQSVLCGARRQGTVRLTEPLPWQRALYSSL